jgi:hypothetical protein
MTHNPTPTTTLVGGAITTVGAIITVIGMLLNPMNTDVMLWGVLTIAVGTIVAAQ